MTVWTQSDGFALIFDSPGDLYETIRDLQALRSERRRCKKSWPAFLGSFVRTNKKAIERQRATLLRLRYDLRRGKWRP